MIGDKPKTCKRCLRRRILVGSTTKRSVPVYRCKCDKPEQGLRRKTN